MSRPLTNVQLEILPTFDYDLPEEDLGEFRQLLVDYFAKKVSDGVHTLFEERGWGQEKNRAWAREHMRTRYKL